ncbi:hypothetical protein [Endozoicomonas sp. Mp262]|uniref:hypothetical protein n=1 Tax=Endozoicomonas sp. Mp262 TaxID=2919499 RepID=UPI0021D993E5
MGSPLSLKDEAYLCMLCLKNSLDRIVRLYWTYIQLRSATGDAPPILFAMLTVLCTKRERLEKKLNLSWPDYMQDRKWHDQEEQMANLKGLSHETQEELQQICATELKLLQLVCLMINRD